MKKIKNILIVCLAGLALVACDKHDKMDDLVYVGKMAPHVLWTVTSTTVNAGDSVPFSVRYYHSEPDRSIDRLEVWYDVNETETKNVSAPWMSSAYSEASDITRIRRISQVISSYAHDENRWDAQKREYFMEAKFPTSNTLATVSWDGTAFDSTNVSTYFGADFMQHFKDTIFAIITNTANDSVLQKDNTFKHVTRRAYSQFSGLVDMVGDTVARDQYLLANAVVDTDWNSTTTYTHFKDDVIPQYLIDLYQGLGFKEIISDAAGNLSISYKRYYYLNSQLKCYDDLGTPGLSLFSVITLN